MDRTIGIGLCISQTAAVVHCAGKMFPLRRAGTLIFQKGWGPCVPLGGSVSGIDLPVLLRAFDV